MIRSLACLAASIMAVGCSSPPPAPAPPPPTANQTGPAAEPCVCTLPSGELQERERWLATFSAGVQAAGEVHDGFELRFSPDWSARLLELIEKERGCCSALAFELRFEPEAGPVLLRCTGPREATEFLRIRLVAGQ